jgi:large conductance mechanosensitive channel
MVKEFKAFLMKGNLVDIAVGLISALAFKTVVDSVVADLIPPIVAAIFRPARLLSLAIDIGDEDAPTGTS